MIFHDIYLLDHNDAPQPKNKNASRTTLRHRQVTMLRIPTRLLFKQMLAIGALEVKSFALVCRLQILGLGVRNL